MSVASVLLASLGRRIPWRVMQLFKARWPSAYQLLQFGTTNINSAAHWNHAWTRHGTGGFRATGEILPIRERVFENVPPGSRVLDVGCGVGEMLDVLRELRECDCCGVDIATAAIEIASSRGFEAKCAKLPHIPFNDAMFDVVVCTETLEHVTNAKGTLRQIARVLKPGGRALFSVPDGEEDDEDVHVHRFSKDALDRLLRADFRVLSIERVRVEETHVLFARVEKAAASLKAAVHRE